MKKKAWVQACLLAGIAATFTGSAMGQHDMGFERSFPPAACSADFGYGFSLKASPTLFQDKLKSLTLSFAHAPEVSLKITPARMSFFTLPDGKPIAPSKVEKFASKATEHGRIVDSVEFTFPPDAKIKNIAFSIEESALIYIEEERRNSIDVNRNLRLMDVASVLNGNGAAQASHPCPSGLVNWKPKEPLERRLQSSDLNVALEASEEVLREAAVSSPERLILAAWHLFRAERKAESAFWMATGIYRATYSGKTSLGYGYYIAATMPSLEYARSAPSLWADTLQKVIQWDDRTYSEWEQDQENFKNSSAVWQRNRTYQRSDTQRFVAQLRKDPKAPALNDVIPVSPADPLRNALDKGDVQAALAAVNAKQIDLNRNYPHSNSYLHIAAGKGLTELIPALIKQGAKTESVDELGSTPLGWARDLSTMQVLLENKADANAPQGLDRQPLLLRLVASGAQRGLGNQEQDEVQKRLLLLLKHGANVNKADGYGQTPLHAAAVRGDIQNLELLISHSANLDAATKTGRDRELANTPLALAKNVETAKYLISKGASLQPAAGDAPLLNAVKFGDIELVRLLLERGSNPNAMSRESKNSALWFAVSSRDRKYLPIAELLIKAGANVKAEVRGKTLMAWAKDFGNNGAVKLLEEAGA